jgi:sugar phosphate isomerase/epimerase
VARRLLSLAAGVLPEFPPEEIVRAAARARYAATGIWCDIEQWSEETTRTVRARLTEEALVPLDIEVVWIRAGRGISDDARRLIDVGGELGARNVLIVSANPDPVENRLQFAALCERAARAGMRAALEFLQIAAVKSLDDALAIVTDVGHPAGALLIDPLHLARCNATPADVARVDPALLPYAQFCDAPARLAPGDSDYLRDALDDRCAPGEGELPLAGLLAALPEDLPLSLEVRSRAYRERFPDPATRARAVLEATYRCLAGGLRDG